MKNKTYKIEYEKDRQVIKYNLTGTQQDLNLELLYRKAEKCSNIKVSEV